MEDLFWINLNCLKKSLIRSKVINLSVHVNDEKNEKILSFSYI